MLAESAALDDAVEAQWRMYIRGFPEDWSAFRPALRDLGLLKDAYLQDGLPIAGDEAGLTAVQGFPNTVGRSVTIQLEGKRRAWSRMAHIPYPTIAMFRHNEIGWPWAEPEILPPYWVGNSDFGRTSCTWAKCSY